MDIAGKAEISVIITKRDGTVVDLGIVTSPYNDKLRNWLWKKRKVYQIKKMLEV